MSATFTCSICCCELPRVVRKRNQSFQCPGCEETFCIGCQERYQLPNCMNCNMEFRLGFIRDVLGARFIANVLKPRIMADLMTEQRANLPRVQPLVDWERRVQKERRNARFGGSVSSAETRPDKLVELMDDVFPCPRHECRGFVGKGSCGTCKESICMNCREWKHPVDIHSCDPTTVLSIVAIHKSTKPCPKCSTMIQRSEGCDHMFCTNCRSHFNYRTGEVLNSSTNQHYVNLQAYSRNVITHDPIVYTHGERSQNIQRPNQTNILEIIEEAGLRSLIPDTLIRSLFDDVSAIQMVKDERYAEPTVIRNREKEYEKHQVRFLLNEITESVWERNVYRIHTDSQKALHIATVIATYMETMASLQRQLLLSVRTDKEFKEAVQKVYGTVCQLVDTCNSSLASLREEYEIPVIRIRSPQDDVDLPAIYLG